MRAILWLSAVFLCSVTGAQAQLVPDRGPCPPNLRRSGAFCLVDLPGSIRNAGSCPAEYVSTADRRYCVLAPRNQWVLVGPRCPAGTRPSASGEHCVVGQAGP